MEGLWFAVRHREVKASSARFQWILMDEHGFNWIHCNTLNPWIEAKVDFAVDRRWHKRDVSLMTIFCDSGISSWHQSGDNSIFVSKDLLFDKRYLYMCVSVCAIYIVSISIYDISEFRLIIQIITPRKTEI